MSEPLSSSEIEDVLSSIRRLVSEDMRPQSAAAVPARPAKVAVPAPDSKLILTPALRVVHDDRRADPPMFVATPRPDYAAQAPLEPAPIESVLASVGAGVDTQDDDWEAEVGDEAPMADAVPPTAEHFEFRPYPEADSEAVDDDDFEPEVDTVEAGFVDMAEEGEHDFIETDFHAETVIPAWAQVSDVEDAVEDDVYEATVEPDAEWAAAAEASVIAALEAEAQDAVAAGFQARFNDAQDDDLDRGEARIDEELLRELVRDVLREELAGRIGERITRNIRKLVRAEIAMALAAQELS